MATSDAVHDALPASPILTPDTPPEHWGAPELEHRRRGRPRGINPQRYKALVEMARSGLTLTEMAAALGVTRQCIHQQLGKYPAIAVEREAFREVRRRLERTHRLRERTIQQVRRRSAHGAALARFLREAMGHGWNIEAAPGRRPRINGVPLAFHAPRRSRGSGVASQGKHLQRYYHVKLAHSDWLHVVCLPTGTYLFYLPDPARSSISIYIPVAAARMPSQWPEWPKLRHRRRTDLKRTGKPGRPAPPAWAA